MEVIIIIIIIIIFIEGAQLAKAVFSGALKEIYRIITILSHELKDVWVKQTYFSQPDIL